MVSEPERVVPDTDELSKKEFIASRPWDNSVKRSHDALTQAENDRQTGWMVMRNPRSIYDGGEVTRFSSRMLCPMCAMDICEC